MKPIGLIIAAGILSGCTMRLDFTCAMPLNSTEQLTMYCADNKTWDEWRQQQQKAKEAQPAGYEL